MTQLLLSVRLGVTLLGVHLPLAFASVMTEIGGEPAGSQLSIFRDGKLLMDLRSEWLRERCTSPTSVDQRTKQQLRNPHEYALPLLQKANANDSRLLVSFVDDHESVFSLTDLETETKGLLVPVQTVEFENVPQRLWNASSFGQIPVVHFDELHAMDEAVLQAYHAMLEVGMLLVRGVPLKEGQCSVMADFLSSLRATEWGKQFNVRPIPDGHKEDLAYGSKAIGMHTDNAYRDPTPDFQLMHAIKHCECDPANVVDGKNCSECTVFNTFTDGKYVAEKMSKENRWAFEQLTSVPVRFENNGGDNTSFLQFRVPHFQLYPDAKIIEKDNQRQCGAECIRSIRFSSKSGGYAPPTASGEFYQAKRLFSEMIHSAENNIYLQLSPGDMVIFDNERILHARSSIAHSDGDRFLQGCYLNRDGIRLGYERLRRKTAAAGSFGSEKNAEL